MPASKESLHSDLLNIRFSVVITCYNQRGFIGAAIDSAVSQDYLRKEIIVVDDGSSDGSVEFIEEYGRAIQFIKLPHNCGALEARNRGAEAAVGEYIVFLDGDDVLAPWALSAYERIVSKRHPKIIFSATQWFEGAVPAADKDLEPKIEFVEYDIFLAKDRRIGASASAFVIDRKTFHEKGGWSPGIFHLDCHDICGKLAITGPMILICSPVMTFYRVHASSSTRKGPGSIPAGARIAFSVTPGSAVYGSFGRSVRFVPVAIRKD